MVDPEIIKACIKQIFPKNFMKAKEFFSKGVISFGPMGRTISYSQKAECSLNQDIDRRKKLMMGKSKR